MEAGKKRSQWPFLALYVVSLLAYAAALVAPPTRRIAREHLAFLVPGEHQALAVTSHLFGDDSGAASLSRERAYAAAHPEDDALQMSLAMRQATAGGGASSTIAYFRSLTPLLNRFPNSTVLRAAIARYGASLGYRASAATAEDWAAFDRAVSEGGALEPENAYFPLTAAMGLHLRGRGPDALRALLRAGGRPLWDEHLREEVEGKWRLSEMGDAQPNGLNRTVTAAAILYPDYAQLRELAKMAAPHRAALEASGRTDEGLAIRHALMHVGGMMRSRSTSLIGNLVGGSLVTLAARDPGGRFGARGAFTQAGQNESRADYEAYLRSIGRTDEADFARREFAAGDAVRDIASADKPEWDFTTLVRPVRAWVNLAVLLAGAMVMLVCAAVVAVLVRMGWADPEKRITWPERIVTTLAAALVVIVPAIFLGQRLLQPARYWLGMFEPKSNAGPVLWVIVVALMSVPIVLKVVVIVGALVRRKPLTPSVVTGFQRAALPLAALMALCYCSALVHLAGRDREMAKAVTSQVQHEGRYYAAQAGKHWPD